MPNRLIYIIVSIILFSNNLYSQEKWTLEKCINYALENNIQIKIQQLNTEINKEDLLKSKLSILPNLNGSASQNYTFGRSVDPYTNQFAENNVSSSSFSASSSMTLFNGFQTINTIKLNSINLKASIEDLQKAKNDITLNITSAFLQILFNEELVNVAKNQADLSKQLVERNQKLLNAGNISQGNFLESQSQLANDEMQLVSAENQLSLSYLSLYQILELGFKDSIKIEKPLIPEPNFSANNYTPELIYQDAIQNLPQIKSAEYKMYSAQKSLAISRGTRSPRLTLNGMYSTGYSSERKMIENMTIGNPYITGYALNGGTMYDVYSYGYNYNYYTPSFSQQLRDNDYKSLSINLTIPIFNNWQANSSISKAKINVLNYEYSYKQTDKQLQKEIQQAYTDAILSLKKYTASKKAFIAQQESFKYTQQKFELGTINIFDFNQSKNSLAKAESELIKSKYEFLFKTKILDFYRGQKITL